jgi:hypothetical protein
VQDHILSTTGDALKPETICSFEKASKLSVLSKKKKTKKQNTEIQGSVVLKNFKKRLEPKIL